MRFHTRINTFITSKWCSISVCNGCFSSWFLYCVFVNVKKSKRASCVPYCDFEVLLPTFMYLRVHTHGVYRGVECLEDDSEWNEIN